MNFRRIWYTFRMCTLFTGIQRAAYLKKKKVFGSIGDHVMIQPRKVPLYPELIYIGDNVRIASNVSFITHDVIHNMLNHLPEDVRGGVFYHEKKGKIVIGNNVFIGANSLIMYDVKIGDNVVIGAGSVVTKSIPDNSVCAGVPCKTLGDFESLLEKRKLNN